MFKMNWRSYQPKHEKKEYMYSRVVQEFFEFLLIGLKDVEKCTDYENMHKRFFKGICDRAHKPNISTQSIGRAFGALCFMY